MTSDEIGRWNEIKVKSSIFQIHLPFSELFKYEGLKVGGLGCGNFGQAPVIMFMEGTPRRLPDHDDLQRMDVKYFRLYPLLCWDVRVIYCSLHRHRVVGCSLAVSCEPKRILFIHLMALRSRPTRHCSRAHQG